MPYLLQKKYVNIETSAYDYISTPQVNMNISTFLWNYYPTLDKLFFVSVEREYLPALYA